MKVAINAIMIMAIIGVFIFGCSDNSRKEDDAWKSQINDPSLLANSYAIPTKTPATEKSKPTSVGFSDANYQALIKNRYPSTGISKFIDFNSDEANKAVLDKMSEENLIGKFAGDNYYVSFDLDTDTENKTLKILSDGNTILENMSGLKENGIVNPEITQAFLNTYPVLAANYVTSVGAAYIIKNLYSIFDQLNTIKVEVYLLWNDEYGEPQEHLIYSFDFDRNLYEKIHWENFRPEKLVTVSHNLHYSTWYQNNILNYY